jgi:hypothetical protein
LLNEESHRIEPDLSKVRFAKACAHDAPGDFLATMARLILRVPGAAIGMSALSPLSRPNPLLSLPVTCTVDSTVGNMSLLTAPQA